MKSSGISVSEEPFDGRKEKKDFTSNFARIKGINPEVVFIIADPFLYSDILLNAKQILGDSVLFVLNNTPDLEIIKNNNSFDNVYIISSFYESKNKFIESDFYKTYKSKFESNPNFYNALGFDEIVLIKEILNNNLNFNSIDFVNKIKDMKFNDDIFVTGFKGFDSNGLAIKPIDILKIINGSISYIGEFHMEND